MTILFLYFLLLITSILALPNAVVTGPGPELQVLEAGMISWQEVLIMLLKLISEFPRLW